MPYVRRLKRPALLLAICILASLSLLQAKEPEELDVVVNHRTHERDMGVILSADGDTIVFRRKGQSRSEDLPAAEYNIAKWDGVTNAAELLDSGKRFIRQAEDHIRECRQTGLQFNSKTTVISSLEQAQEVLERIKNEADAREPYREARELLNRYDKWELTQKLEEAGAIFQVAKELEPQYARLQTALQDDGWNGVTTQCEWVDETLKEMEGQDPSQEKRAAIKQIRSGVKGLQKGAERLKGLNDTVGLRPEPSKIPPAPLLDAAGKIDDTIAELDGILAVEIFPMSVDALVEKRRLSLVADRKNFEAFVDEARLIVKTTSRLDDIEESIRQNLGQQPYQIDEQYDELKRDIKEMEAQFQSTSDLPARYALDYLGQLRRRADQDLLDLLVACHAFAVQKALVPAESLKTVFRASAAGRQLADRLREIEKLLARNLSDQQKQDVLTLVDQIKAGQAECVCRELEIGLEEAQGQLGGMPDEQAPSALAARIKENEQLSEQVKELEKKAAVVKKDLPASQNRVDQLLQRLADVGGEAETERGLLELFVQFSGVPDSIKKREQLEEGERLLAKANGALEALPVKSGDALSEMHQQAVGRAEELKKHLQAAVPLVEGLEKDEALEGRLAEAEAALGQGKYRAVRTSLRPLSASLAALKELVDSAPWVKEDARLSVSPELHARRLAQLESRLDQELTQARRNAGWIPLPIQGEPLVAPEPENEILEIDLLIGDMRLDEAAEKLAKFTTTHDDPAIEARLEDLRMRLTFLEATVLEGKGDLSAARDLYEQLVGKGEIEHPLSAAAASAVARVKTQLRAEETQRSNHIRLLMVAAAVLVGLGLAGLLFWRDSAAVRLKRAERELRAAAACTDKSDGSERDLRLERAAQLLSRFPEDHPRASQLRRWLSEPERVPSQRRRFEAAIPDPPSEAVVDRLLALPDPDPTAIEFCLAWLASQGAGDLVRRPQVVEWLKRHLAPAVAMTEEELQWRVQYSHRCAEILRDEVWPRVWEVCALWWLGKTDEIAFPAEQIEFERLPEIERPDLCLVLAQSLAHLGQWQRSLDLFKELAGDPKTVRQANTWRAIARAVAKSQEAKAHGLRIAATLLTD